jgi:hypothetical protein
VSQPDETQPGEFAKRIRKRSTSSTSSEVRIVEEENDFPFASLDFIRVGSAHNVSKPENDAVNANLLERIANHVMGIFQPESLPVKIEIEKKE